MTKYNKSEVNLKSTAYNQNGQNYFEQLTAYNSMSAHLRRILLTKCTVDARNKTYIRKKRQTNGQIDYKPRFVKTEITDNIIDSLAYDTLYHPVEFLKLNYGQKFLCQCDAQNHFANCYDCAAVSSRTKLQNHLIYPNSPTFRANNLEQFVSNSKNVKERRYMQSNSSCKKIFKPVDSKNGMKIHIHRYDENSTFYESTSDFLSQNINHLSSVVSTPRSGVTRETNFMDNQTVYRKDEEIKYIKFVYEITQEIILNGLYADNELQELFKKHIKKNKTILDTNRMQYEIYQLKRALNMSNNSEDKELDDSPYIQYLVTAPYIPEENKGSEELLKSQ
ncbi:uncharacterized protein LOC143423417 [Xylocopa sonorina]|uniref:uncharacterized protein LOC143423417 n=1 Tax=Xylocopa sonorina TaxID=1818115 RepID=UPI00403AE0CC